MKVIKVIKAKVAPKMVPVELTIEDDENSNWMHTLPGYKDEAEITANALKGGKNAAPKNTTQR